MSDRPDKKKASSSPPKFMSLNDLKKRDSEENTYYAGMAIEGAGRPELDRVKKIFEEAHRQGQNFKDEDDDESKGKSFSGHGQSLSDTTKRPTPSLEQSSRHERVKRVLTFWKNGFAVSDEGPLYEYDDPNNQKLLERLQSGEAPIELLNVLPGQQVDVMVAHKMSQDFVASKPKVSAFQGKGHKLGDLAETIPKNTDLGSSSSRSIERAGPLIDSSKPTTNLQIRFSNGSRENVTVNTNMTVNELFKYLLTKSNVQISTLLAGRPPVKLSPDDNRTIEDAQLLNSVIIQQ